MVSKVITAVAEGVAKAGPETPKSGFKAYHGSPYQFEQFDIEKAKEDITDTKPE